MKRITTTALALAGGLLLACPNPESMSSTEMGYVDDGPSTVQMVTTQLGPKNVYVPSTVILTEGSGRKLSIFNTTDTPHGFSIPTLGVEAVLQPGQENVIDLPDLEGGHIHTMRCQLHPAHRTGTLMVVHKR